jgi:hypothetical protein
VHVSYYKQKKLVDPIATPPTFFYPLRKILIGPCMASWAVQGTTLRLLYECVNLGFWHRVKIEGTQFCFSAGGRIWARHAWHLGCSADSEMVYRFSFFYCEFTHPFFIELLV